MTTALSTKGLQDTTLALCEACFDVAASQHVEDLGWRRVYCAAAAAAAGIAGGWCRGKQLVLTQGAWQNVAG